MTESVTVEVSKDLQNLASIKECCPELIQEINDFCWLWPAFERGQPTTNFTDQSNTDAEREAREFYSNRYLTGPKASDRLNELVRNCSEANKVRELSSEQLTRQKRALRFVVQRIRNNLFHGNKANNGIKRDELDLFKHANRLLRVWIGIPEPND